MDVEEISRRHLAAGTPDDDIVHLLSRDILAIKHNRISSAYAGAFARAVLAEAKNSTGLSGDLFAFEPSGSTMGEFGVGSRGSGDFFAHRQLARIIGRTSAAVGVDEMDDAGAVRAGGTTSSPPSMGCTPASTSPSLPGSTSPGRSAMSA